MTTLGQGLSERGGSDRAGCARARCARAFLAHPARRSGPAAPSCAGCMLRHGQFARDRHPEWLCSQCHSSTGCERAAIKSIRGRTFLRVFSRVEVSRTTRARPRGRAAGRVLAIEARHKRHESCWRSKTKSPLIAAPRPIRCWKACCGSAICIAARGTPATSTLLRTSREPVEAWSKVNRRCARQPRKTAMERAHQRLRTGDRADSRRRAAAASSARCAAELRGDYLRRRAEAIYAGTTRSSSHHRRRISSARGAS